MCNGIYTIYVYKYKLHKQTRIVTHMVSSKYADSEWKMDDKMI